MTQEKENQPALTELQIPHPNPVIVLMGGAGGIDLVDQFPMRKAIKIISRFAEETQSVVVDGGTQAGIMLGGRIRLDLEDRDTNRRRSEVNYHPGEWRTDVGYSVLKDRPTFVMRGAGRMADEITLGDKIIAIAVSQKPDDILEFLKTRLTECRIIR